MKTIKIPEQLHKDIRKLQANLELKTIPQTIRFLWCYYFENDEGDYKHEEK